VLGLMFLNNNLVLLEILVFLQKMGLSVILIMVKDRISKKNDYFCKYISRIYE
jgi:hypothetical protein